MQAPIVTFGDLIDRFGGAAKMAPLIGVAPNRVRQWSCRNSIPGRFWRKIIDAAKEQGIRGVNAAKLAELASAPAEAQAA